MSSIDKFIGAVSHELANNDQFRNALNTNPQQALNNLKRTVVEIPDTWIYRIVVLALGITVVSVVIGVLILMLTDTSTDDRIPSTLTAIGSTALGALTGLLAPSPQERN